MDNPINPKQQNAFVWGRNVKILLVLENMKIWGISPTTWYVIFISAWRKLTRNCMETTHLRCEYLELFIWKSLFANCFSSVLFDHLIMTNLPMLVNPVIRPHIFVFFWVNFSFAVSMSINIVTDNVKCTHTFCILNTVQYSTGLNMNPHNPVILMAVLGQCSTYPLIDSLGQVKLPVP